MLLSYRIGKRPDHLRAHPAKALLLVDIIYVIGTCGSGQKKRLEISYLQASRFIDRNKTAVGFKSAKKQV